jgi:hypothetical protein
MSKNYELVNPYIIGSFNRIVTADNSLQAAHLTYQSLSQYITGHMPNFKFTLQRVKTGYQTGGGKDTDYLHYQVFEKKAKKNSTNNNIEYVIKPIKSTILIDNFQQKLQNLIKRKDNNILSSEESEDNLHTQTQMGGKKYVEDDELDPDLEADFDAIINDEPTKRKTKKGKRWIALNGPLKGQAIYPSPISYYRYDPVIYNEYISYIPIFTEEGRPKRMVYDIYTYTPLLKIN